MERTHPVQGTALSRRRAVCIHPVHALLREQRHQRLSQLLDSLVKCLRRRMAILAQDLILRRQQTLYCTHQRATLTRQVTYGLALERRLEQIAGTDTDTQRQRTIQSAACGIVVYSIRAVQATALQEHGTQRCAATLWCNHDDIDVFRRNTSRAVTPRYGKTMAEIQSLAWRQIFLQCRPHTHYRSIAQQAHHYACLVCSLFDREQRLTRNPAVCNSLLEGLALTLAYDYVKSVVTQVAGLSWPLNTIADYGNQFILQNLTSLFQRKFLTCHYLLDNATKIHLCHFLILFLVDYSFLFKHCLSSGSSATR